MTESKATDSSASFPFGGGSGGWALLLLAAAAIVIGMMSAGSPPSAEEAAERLAAQSLVSDGDFLFGIEDETRMRLRAWPESIRPPMVMSADGTVSFQGPLFYPVLLAPFQAVAGRFGAVILNGVLLVLAVVIVRRSLEARSGDTSAWLVAACVFGSVVFFYISTSLPVALLVAATAGAMALFTTSIVEISEEIPDLYQGELPVRRAFVRFGVAGLLVGVVAAHDPVYALLLLAPLALTNRDEWSWALGSGFVGMVVALALCWVTTGLWAEQAILPGSPALVEVSVGSGATGVERSDALEEGVDSLILAVTSPTLALWNAVYAMAGRHVGLLPYFLPLVLLVGGWRLDFGRGMLIVIAGAGLVASLVLSPFDFADLPSALGNRAFVPFYVMLWWLPTREVGQKGGLVWIILAAVVLWPLWIPGKGPLARVESGDFPRGPLLELLPTETTQRDLPVRGEVVMRDLLVRPQAGLDPAGRRGHFVLPRDREGELIVASPGSVRSLRIVFDSAASSELELSGGELGFMTLTPDRGVAFEIRLPEGVIRHPVWWSAEEHSFHRLRLRMPGARGATVFSIEAGR